MKTGISIQNKMRQGAGAISKRISFLTPTVIAVIVILFVISAIYALCQSANTASVNISAHFSEVTLGKNPDGSPFQIHEIMSKEVLEKASEKLGGKMDAKLLEKHLHISYSTNDGDIKRLYQKIRDGETDFQSVPTRYQLSYKIVPEQIRAEGVFASIGAVLRQIALPSKRKILKAVSESYQEYYQEKYIQKGALLTPDWSQADGLDYYKKAMKTSANVAKVSRILNTHYNQNPTFVAENEKIGFGELYAEVGNILAVDVENLKSFVIKNGLTTDRDKLLRQFLYMEAQQNNANMRLTKNYGIIKDTINIYDANVTRVVFIPALDYDDNFYMNRTKVGMDYLVEQADSTKTAADEAKGSAMNYQYLTNQFLYAEAAPAEVYQQADMMYEAIKEKLSTITEKAKTIIAEEKETQSLTELEISKPYATIGLVAMAISGAKLFIMLLMIAYLVMSLGAWLRKRNEKE